MVSLAACGAALEGELCSLLVGVIFGVESRFSGRELGHVEQRGHANVWSAAQSPNVCGQVGTRHGFFSVRRPKYRGFPGSA